MANKKRKQLNTYVGPRGSERLVNCIENPSAEEILEELMSLPGGKQISCVEILISNTDHISISGSVSEKFYIRFQEFSEAGQYESPDGDIPLEVAMKIIVSYIEGSDFWRSALNWQRLKIKSKLEKLNEEREINEATKILVGVVGFIGGFFGGSKK